ncbi:unnamed protein product [Trifolium pratense]|uniref:Uncharacterized protein n=1 Tax=Trifolium pratense TaxID=57577 RepID=A0ACB0JZ98_TRIPR|nr:unnamed protein product [Trifolium pratense]
MFLVFNLQSNSMSSTCFRLPFDFNTPKLFIDYSSSNSSMFLSKANNNTFSYDICHFRLIDLLLIDLHVLKQSQQTLLEMQCKYNRLGITFVVTDIPYLLNENNEAGGYVIAEVFYVAF